MAIVLDGTTGITTPDLTDSSLTSGRVVYAGTSGNLTGSTALTFDGAILGVNGISVGRGAGAVATNTAVGASALAAVTGGYNTAFGQTAGSKITSGTENTAIGQGSMSNGAAVTSDYNTGVGTSSLYNLTSGTSNTGVGQTALSATSSGSYNTAVGKSALQSNTTASNNTAVGYQSGYATTTGANNLFLGYQAGYATTTAYQCTALGANSLKANVTNLNCVAVGYEALLASTGNSNTALGKGAGSAITTGYGHTIIGAYSGNQGGLDIRTAGNYIVLSDGDGNPRARWDNNGRPFFPDLGSDAGTNTVKFNTGTGRLSYDTSSARYKDNIRDSVYGLSHVMQMRSTQFEYKEGGRSDVGLIAEELQPIVPELVGINKEGQADSVSYDRMVSVLVKAIQELKAEFDAYKSTHP